MAQDRGGPTELAAYRLDQDRYTCDVTAKAGQGPATVTASPVPVDIDIAALRL
ncbi:hypothetical protein [Saccharopolyspora taberi]|uniref:Uncharacterized protein n=1 Tax=Saccharopolyspora taberi TaxID=60895 RepID=A0ABN3VIS7_9PSEU